MNFSKNTNELKKNILLNRRMFIFVFCVWIYLFQGQITVQDSAAITIIGDIKIYVPETISGTVYIATGTKISNQENFSNAKIIHLEVSKSFQKNPILANQPSKKTKTVKIGSAKTKNDRKYYENNKNNDTYFVYSKIGKSSIIIPSTDRFIPFFNGRFSTFISISFINKGVKTSYCKGFYDVYQFPQHKIRPPPVFS